MGEGDCMVKKILEFIKKWAPYVIIGVLLCIILLRECSRPGPCPEIVADTTTVHDTIPGDPYPVEVPVIKPKIIYRDTGRVVTLPVDTDAIIYAFFTENYYDIVFRDDTSALCEYKFSVYGNEVQMGEFVFQNRRPWHITNTTVVTPIEKERNFKLYAGVSVGRSLNEFGLAPRVGFGWKDFMFGGSYDLINNDVYIDLMYKISFRKKKI